MSTIDEQDIRTRLHSAMDEIDTSPPPVRAVVGRGRHIRWERRAGAGAALAVLVAAGAAVPGLHSASTGKTVTAAPAAGGQAQAGPAARQVGKNGVIATGNTDEQRWTITLQRENGSIVANAPGVTGVLFYAQDKLPVSMSAAVGGPHARLVLAAGAVRPDVTAVTVKFAGGTQLHLVPVPGLGRRWVSMVMPRELTVTNIIAYGRRGELGHAVPFTPDPLNGFRVLRWLGPGQSGPARSSTRLPFLVVGPGAQSHVAGTPTMETGPWGWCVTPGDKQSAAICDADVATNRIKITPERTVIDVGGGGGVAQPGVPAYDYELAQAAPRVSRVQLRLSDGSVRNIRAVATGSGRYLAYLLSGVTITQWTTFDAAGHQLGTGTGASL